MDNFAPKTDRGLRRHGPGLRGAALLALSLLSWPGHAAEFEISADSFTVVNQVNISSVTYFSTRAIVPPNPALATQLLTPGGLYFDATYYNVWDRTALAWVKLATGTVEAGRVSKAGDFMSGQLTTASTITVQGNAFSVGASTFVVIGGNVGIGTTTPAQKLSVTGTIESTTGGFKFPDGTTQTTAANGMPVGAIMTFAMNSCPSGWLAADGSAVSRTTYASLFSAVGTTFGAGDGTTTFALPELRGEFIRGWDNGRGIDTARTFGSAQADVLKAHSHDSGLINDGLGGNGASAAPAKSSGLGVYTTGSTGGSETRPRNIALLFCIKT